jgi:hypothetical protein
LKVSEEGLSEETRRGFSKAWDEITRRNEGGG